MTLCRLSLSLLATVLVAGAAVAQAGDRGLAGGSRVSRSGLTVDPQLLPPDSGAGDCVTRRVTGPGGAYRWDRVDCAVEHGRGGFNAWGRGHRPLSVDLPPQDYADAYGDRRFEDRPFQDQADNRHAYVIGAGQGYSTDARERPDDRYGPPPSRQTDYRYAGRDADGFLVWPGKTP